MHLELWLETSTVHYLPSHLLSLPPRVTWAVAPAVMDFLYPTVCKYIIIPSFLSVFLHIQESVSLTRHCVPC